MSTSSITAAQLSSAKSLYNSIADQINKASTDIDRIESIEKIKKQYEGTLEEANVMHCIAQILESTNMLKIKSADDNSKNGMDINTSQLDSERYKFLEVVQRISREGILTSQTLTFHFKNQYCLCPRGRDPNAISVKEGTEIFVQILKESTNFIKVILVSHGHLPNPIMLEFFKIVLQNKTALHVHLNFAILGNEFLEYLAIPLENSALVSLSITNSIIKGCDNSIAKLLQENTSITDLNLSFREGDISPDEHREAIQKIGAALLNNNTLTSINLYGQLADREDYDALLKVVQQNRSLTSLVISDPYTTHILDLEMFEEISKSFIQALTTNTSLTDFTFECWRYYNPWNQDVNAINAISDLLRNNNTLTSLHTGYWNGHENKNDPNDIQLIMEALNENHSLTHATLPMVCMDFKTALNLLETLKYNKYLLYLKITYGDNNENDDDFTSCEHRACLRWGALKQVENKINKILEKNIDFRFYWARVSIFIAFVRTHANNPAIQLSIVPLIQTILNFAEIGLSEATKTRLARTNITSAQSAITRIATPGLIEAQPIAAAAAITTNSNSTSTNTDSNTRSVHSSPTPQAKRWSEIINTKYFQACISAPSTQKAMTTMNTSSNSSSSSSSSNSSSSTHSPLSLQPRATAAPMLTNTQPAAAAAAADTTNSNSTSMSADSNTRNGRKRRHE